MASRCLGICTPVGRSLRRSAIAGWRADGRLATSKLRSNLICAALKETSAATETVSAEPQKKENEDKPKRTPAKAQAKSLSEMMEEDVIPALKSTLESEVDISEIELSFNDNRVSNYSKVSSFGHF